ncbi:MAG TPA: GAF domain-containing protein [Anaeromyxobacter sp.]|nr:GAF domain-containing protein [Anaeromyxobacter sp.]
MGKRLVSFFDEAYRIGGLPARVALAKHTATTPATAEAAEDAPALIARFEKAVATLRVEFRDAAHAPAARAPLADDPRRAQQLAGLLSALSARQATFLDDPSRTAREIVETAAQGLQVARASVWLYDSTRTAIECLDLFERPANKHSSGLRLTSKDFPVYFRVLEVARAIDADDAHTDVRTSCFSEPYLKPLGINSMLDIPIWAHDRMMGVLCHEHIGPKRRWLAAEADFGVALAKLLSEALERNG